MQLADTATLLSEPLHPYTEMLLEAAPGLRKDHYVSRPAAIPNSKAAQGVGCPLAGRCPRQIGSLCGETRPPLQATGNGFVRCHLGVEALPVHSTPTDARDPSAQKLSSQRSL
jgi:peptide/nickel transport system ATP-binding protein